MKTRVRCFAASCAVVSGSALSARGFRKTKPLAVAKEEQLLQASIWKWEQEQEDHGLEYGAIQEGLAILETLELDDDGTQEGLTALLEGMRSYPKNGDDEDFHSYATRVIERGVSTSTSEGDIRLPRKVQSILKQAMELLRDKPTIGEAELARTLNVPVHRLRDYLRLVPKSLSMETTVEIFNPAIDESPTFLDQEEFETSQGWHLDTGEGVRKDQLIEAYLDEMIETEGNDESWIQQEQIAGPLSDTIPDETNMEQFDDDMVLEELIRTNLSRVLSSTLQPQQVKILRLYFGLDEAALSTEAIAQTLQLSTERVSELLGTAISQLRAVYAEKYLQNEEENGIEESV